MLLNAAKCKDYSFYCFWITKGKWTGGRGCQITPSSKLGLTTEAIYSINSTKSNKRFVSNLHYNWGRRFLFVNATKINPLKAKNSETIDYAVFR